MVLLRDGPSGLAPDASGVGPRTPCETGPMSGPRVLATLEGYAVEGGFDRRGEPATCYRRDRSRSAVTPDRATPDGLWRDYEAVARPRGRRCGLDGVRLERRVGARRTASRRRRRRRPGPLPRGRAARARRGARVRAWSWSTRRGRRGWASRRGSCPWVEPRVLDHARRVVDALGDVVDGVVVFADARGVVARGFLEGTAPPWRRARPRRRRQRRRPDRPDRGRARRGRRRGSARSCAANERWASTPASTRSPPRWRARTATRSTCARSCAARARAPRRWGCSRVTRACGASRSAEDLRGLLTSTRAGRSAPRRRRKKVSQSANTATRTPRPTQLAQRSIFVSALPAK